MRRAAITAIFETFSRRDPHPVTELRYENPFTLLVAIILSAQATDASVNKATPALFAVADTPEKMLALGAAGIAPYIRTIGLFNSKATYIEAMSRRVMEHFGGVIPRDRMALETLPGVGRKTANVWLNCIYEEPRIAVDTHVFRVANRTGLAPGATVGEVETLLEQNVPETFKRHAHHWLILHGRYTCTARKPACGVCLIYQWCEFSDKNLACVFAS